MSDNVEYEGTGQLASFETWAGPGVPPRKDDGMSDLRPIGTDFYRVHPPTIAPEAWAEAKFTHTKYTVTGHRDGMETVITEVVAWVGATWNGACWIPVLQNHADVPDWLFDYLYGLSNVQRLFFHEEM